MIVCFRDLILFIFFCLKLQSTLTWTLRYNQIFARNLNPLKRHGPRDSSSLFNINIPDLDGGKKSVNPFDLNDEELGELKLDMTKDLFADWAEGQTTIPASTFLDNFQEIIGLGLITEGEIQGIFRKHGVVPSTSAEATANSNQLNYLQFQKCFNEINGVCFDQTYDIPDEEEMSIDGGSAGGGPGGSGGSGSGSGGGGFGKGFGNKPSGKDAEDPFTNIPDGYSFRP